MQTLHLIAGTPEWHAHRAQHFNASDASAMLGCSPYETRSQLLRRLASGVKPEVDTLTQRRFDDGHRYEALARSLAEEIIGEELAPVVGVLEGTRLSASFDGLTLMSDTAWEHKTLNADLRACMKDQGNGYSLPKHYQVQMEQQLIVSGAERVLFMASEWTGDGTLVEERHCWYASDPKLRAEIIAAWRQFDADLAAYTPPEVVDVIPITPRGPDQLPALRSSVKGEMVLESNIKEWEEAALAYIKSVRDHEMKTDEDFASADAAAKWCDSSKLTLQGVKASLMSATGDVNTAVATLDRIVSELDKTRIAFTNAIKARKEARKTEIVTGAAAALREHVAGLNARLGAAWMPATAAQADFAGAIKGKSSLTKMQDAVDTLLANSKIAASATADRIQANREQLRPQDGVAGEDWIRLFPDFAQVCTKSTEDFHNLVTARVVAERQRQEAERARIRAEEEARAAEKVREEQEAAAREQRQREEAEAAERRQEQEAAAPARSPAPDPAIMGGTRAFTSGVFSHLQERESAPLAAAPIVPMPTKAPAGPPTLRLGELQKRIAPLSIDAAGLAALGFPHAKQEAAAKLWHEHQFGAICDALIAHVRSVRDERRAA